VFDIKRFKPTPDDAQQAKSRHEFAEYLSATCAHVSRKLNHCLPKHQMRSPHAAYCTTYRKMLNDIGVL
jgi:hypothetical protein